MTSTRCGGYTYILIKRPTGGTTWEWHFVVSLIWPPPLLGCYSSSPDGGLKCDIIHRIRQVQLFRILAKLFIESAI